MEGYGVIRPRRRDQTGEGVFNLEWRSATSGKGVRTVFCKPEIVGATACVCRRGAADGEGGN